MLWRHDITPAPERKTKTTWTEFIRSNRAVLAATAFLSVEVLTLGGLLTYYVLFFIQIETRRVEVAGITQHPDARWMKQMARNVTMDEWASQRQLKVSERFPMRILHHNDMSTCSQKVRFALAEKGLDYESRLLNLRAGDQQHPEYLKLNPNAVVPTLVDGASVLIESTVINEYLDDAYQPGSLKPTQALNRARMSMWTKQLDEGVHAATNVVSSCIAFRFQHFEM